MNATKVSLIAGLSLGLGYYADQLGPWWPYAIGALIGSIYCWRTEQ